MAVVMIHIQYYPLLVCYALLLFVTCVLTSCYVFMCCSCVKV